MDEPVVLVPKSKPKAKKVYGCPQCSYKANRAYNVQRHLVQHFEKPPKELQHICQHAGCTFTTMRWDNLSRHQRRVHQMPKPIVEQSVEVNTEDINSESIEELQSLSTCEELASMLSEDIPVVFPPEEPIESDPTQIQQDLPKESIKSHQKEKRVRKPRKNYKSGKTRYFECTTCDYRTNRGYNIKRHIDKHMVKQGAELVLHVCVIASCGFSTPRWDNLRRHVKRVHPETELSPNTHPTGNL